MRDQGMITENSVITDRQIFRRYHECDDTVITVRNLHHPLKSSYCLNQNKLVPAKCKC